MPTFSASPDLQLHYLVDDFTEPWTEPETILLLHGNAESGLAWYAWVPVLARRFRVVRPDMRGYGASTPMPRDFAWTLDGIIDDWDFHWQGGYTFKQPIPLPAGTRIDMVAIFDNSAENRRQPSKPPRPVSWGEGTTDEMAIVFIGLTVDGERIGWRPR